MFGGDRVLGGASILGSVRLSVLIAQDATFSSQRRVNVTNQLGRKVVVGGRSLFPRPQQIYTQTLRNLNPACIHPFAKKYTQGWYMVGS